jgi:nitroreductase
MSIIETLNWRYATKRFSDKKVSEKDLKTMHEAIRLSPSSYGLQLFKVLDIRDEKIKEELKPAAWGQAQITESSNLFVFCNYTEITEGHIDEVLKLKSEIQNIPIENLNGYGDFMKSKILALASEAQSVWTAKQCYIALSNLMNSAAELGIDSCPMEGFEPDKFNEILGLKKKGLNAAVICAVGYRSDEDPTSGAPKVRKPLSDLIETI